jgi:hypothetical protein
MRHVNCVGHKNSPIGLMRFTLVVIMSCVNSFTMKHVFFVLLVTLTGCKDDRNGKHVPLDNPSQGKLAPSGASSHQAISTNMESILKLIKEVNANSDVKREEVLVDGLVELLRIDYSGGRGFITIAPVVGQWNDNEKPQVFLLTLNKSKNLEKVATCRLELNQSKNIRTLMLVE